MTINNINSYQFQKKIFLILFLIIVFLSCVGGTKESDSKLETINVPNSRNSELFLSEIAESVELIQLETIKNGLLGYVLDVQLLRDRLFIHDSFKISVFNLKGNFLNILGKSGDGPGEYGIIYSIAIDHLSGLIYVASERKLHVYNSNLQFIKEKKFPILLQFIGILNHRPILISETLGVKVINGFANQTNLFELDPDLQIVDSIHIRTVVLPERIISGYPFKHYLSVVENDNFLYKPVLTPENSIRDTLYKISGRELIPYIKLNFQKAQSLNIEGFKNTNINNIIYSKSYLICEYEHENQLMMFLFDRKKLIGYNLEGGIRDNDGEKVLLRPLDLSNDTFYFVKEVKFENSETEESNPIIGIVKLK